MEYSDLHVKENQERHSCFLCLGVGAGAFREEATADFRCYSCRSVLSRCPGLWLASFSTLILHLPFLLTPHGSGHVGKVQVKALSP